MTFASPAWLLCLLPWAAVVLWLLMGKHQRTAVPFIELWRGSPTRPRIRPKFYRPPTATLCVIAAMLLSIVGAARPRIGADAIAENQQPVSAPPPPSPVTITELSARAAPRPAVMVRVRNDSDEATADLKIAGKSHSIELPPRGQDKNYFAEFDQALPSIDVQLGNHRAILTRRQAWPILEPLGDLPPEIRRIIDAYSKLRPPGQMSTRVLITDRNPPNDRPAIVVPSPARSASGAIHVEDHPIAAHVDWAKALVNASVAAAPKDWRPIVSIGDSAAVAIRESPARQVWIGFTSESWPRSSDFVVFATNAFDWAGRGGDVYEAKLAGASMPATSPATSNVSAAHFVDLASMTLLFALAMLGLGALLWTKSN